MSPPSLGHDRLTTPTAPPSPPFSPSAVYRTQLIAFSNFMQTLSCICHMAAMFVDEFRQLAVIIDLIADLVTASVAGCMTAQIRVEVKDAKSGGSAPVAAEAVPMGAPATTIDDSKVNANVIARD